MSFFFGTLSPVSTRATWIETLEVFDDDTDERFDFSTATEITVEVRDKCGGALLSGKLSRGDIILPEVGVMQWRFEVGQMNSLCGAHTYEIGVTIELDGDTTQVLIGRLPILDGVVS
jgi:hypothetical protein